MALNFPQIGKISKRQFENLFEWKIPVLGLKDPFNSGFISPDFHLWKENTEWNTSWCLIFKPLGSMSLSSEHWFGVYLVRKDSGSPKSVTYTLGINTTWGNKTFAKTHIFHKEDPLSGEPELLERKQLVPLSHSGFYKVIINCRIHTINCSSASLQETPGSVSCAVQTEIPYSISCAVQTEAPNSVIDKENFKDKAWSSSDTKDVTLLSERMKDLLKERSDHDVTICVQNKEFRAHRIILSARSPVFAMMLDHDTIESSTGTISIEDCDPDSFDEFLLYVYSGRTENLTPSKALQIYYTADKYDFPALKERCVSILKTSLSITSICDVILMATKHGETELLKEASEYFARNIEEILITVGWQRFLCENPVEANELYIKSIKFYLTRH